MWLFGKNKRPEKTKVLDKALEQQRQAADRLYRAMRHAQTERINEVFAQAMPHHEKGSKE